MYITYILALTFRVAFALVAQAHIHTRMPDTCEDKDEQRWKFNDLCTKFLVCEAFYGNVSLSLPRQDERGIRAFSFQSPAR